MKKHNKLWSSTVRGLLLALISYSCNSIEALSLSMQAPSECDKKETPTAVISPNNAERIHHNPANSPTSQCSLVTDAPSWGQDVASVLQYNLSEEQRNTREAIEANLRAITEDQDLLGKQLDQVEAGMGEEFSRLSQKVLTKEDLQKELKQFLEGSKINTARLQRFEKLIQDRLARSVTQEDFKQRIGTLEKALKKALTVNKRHLKDTAETVQGNYEALSNRIANAKKSLAELVLKLHSRMEVVFSTLLYQKSEASQQITAIEVREAFCKAQQGMTTALERQQAQYTQVLRGISNSMQEAVVKKLTQLEKTQGRSLTAADLQKVLTDVQLVATELKGMKAILRDLLQQATEAKEYRKQMKKSIVTKVCAYVTRERKQGQLETREMMQQAFSELKSWLLAQPRGGLDGVIQGLAIELDKEKGLMLSKCYPSVEVARKAVYAADVAIVKSEHTRGRSQHKQGKDWEEDDKQTAAARYERAIKAYEQALKEFPTTPSPGTDLFRLYQEVQRDLQEAKEDLARVRG